MLSQQLREDLESILDAGSSYRPLKIKQKYGKNTPYDLFSKGAERRKRKRDNEEYDYLRHQPKRERQTRLKTVRQKDDVRWAKIMKRYE